MIAFRATGPPECNGSFYRARYYDPGRGRFVSEDKLGLLAGLNLYRYALNNPLGFRDPSGLDVTVTLYRGAGGFGHVGAGVNTASPLATWGHYPKEQAVHTVPGEVVRDAVHKSDKDILDTITIPTNADQDRAMLRVINRSVGNRWYKLTERNCATFVEEVLRAGDVEAPDTILPRELMDQLKRIHGGGGFGLSGGFPD